MASPRFFQPKTLGALSETAINLARLKSAKHTYYRMMGWDDIGVPTRTRFEELHIDWVVEHGFTPSS